MDFVRKKFFLTLLASITAILISLLVAEGSVRLIVDDGMQYDLEMWKNARKLKRSSVDHVQGHEHIPNQSGRLMGVDLSINSYGYRGREIALEKKDEHIRILMLGDSLTFGWGGVPHEETVSRYLEKHINENGFYQSAEVINTGVGNTNTKMQVAHFLAHGNSFSPNIVVLNYFINDAEPTPRRKTKIISEFSKERKNLIFGLAWVTSTLTGKLTGCMAKLS